MVWVLGALSLGAPALVGMAYFVSLAEIDEVLDDGLRQSALLLADRDLAGTLHTQPGPPVVPYGDTESMLVAIARRPDGSLIFTSQPEFDLHLASTPGASVQSARGTRWHVFTVVQADRIVQVAQPVAARREVAAESASQLLVPLLALIAMIGGLLVFVLRRGLKPLGDVNAALAQRGEASLAPLNTQGVPAEALPMVHTLNDLLRRLDAAFEAQRAFVADAAHELRSPVTALQLQVQLLERAGNPAEQAAATAELSAGIARMRHLIGQLLQLSRVSTDGNGPAAIPGARLELGDLARSAVVRFSTMAESRHIDLGADVRAESFIDGDTLQLEMLIDNLIDNALRYTPPGGTVDVVVESDDGTPRLHVIDSGPGLPHDERERVFDRFYRSPAALASTEVGSGLGLAIVRTIADRHGAAVSLHDGKDSRGLEVRVTFTKSS